jgi:hypothetical protein
MIDLSHEALITAWPTLRHWVERYRADEERKRALAAKVAEWNEARRRGFHDAKLLDAVELLDAERYLEGGAAIAGFVPGLAALVEQSRAALRRSARQRDEARRLLALGYQERGRQLLLEGRPMGALPYLVRAREIAEAAGPREVSPVCCGSCSGEAARVLPIATFAHADRIERLAFSPDGARLATASRDRTARLWDAITGAPRCRRSRTATRCSTSRSIRPAHASPPRAPIAACGSGTPPPARSSRRRSRTAARRTSPAGAPTAARSSPRAGRPHRAGSGTRPPARRSRRRSPSTAKIALARLSPRAADPRRRRAPRGAGLRRRHRPARAHPRPPRHRAGRRVQRRRRRIVTASADRNVRIWDAASGAELLAIAHPASSRPRRARSRRPARPHRVRRRGSASGTPSPGRRCVPADRTRGPGSPAPRSARGGAYVVTASFDRRVRTSDANVRPRRRAAVRAHAGGAADGGRPRRAADREPRSPTAPRACGASRARGPARWGSRTRGSGSTPSRSIAAGRAWRPPAPTAPSGCGTPARGGAPGLVLEHGHPVSAVAFAPDGARLIAAAGPEAVLWDAATGACLRVLAHEKPVSATAFSPTAHAS